jgi:cobalt-zinc-cadmium efflux system membrane fusion protein
MNILLKLLFLTISLVLAPQLALAAGDHDHHGHTEHDDHEEDAKGPHGGKLLHDGDVTLELAIYERGIPPEYRAWITHDGKPVDQAELTVTLTRLGGREDRFSFIPTEDYWRGDGVVEEPHSFDVAVELQYQGDIHRWQWESHEGRVRIAADMAEKAGIGTAIAGPGTLERQIPLYGRLVTPPDQTARLRARFPGVVTAVQATVGDAVKQGDVLALIESNESLQTYPLRAPLDSVVQRRAVNVGEVTGDEPLFELIDTRQLWAEFKVFPDQRRDIKTGQNIHIRHGDHNHTSPILSINPGPDEKPYVLARAVLPNLDQHAVAGDLVKGTAVIENLELPLLVDNRALQGFRDWTVVFIQVGDTYEIRPLALGRSDGRFTEVLEGLQAGDRYVVENSYLIKADIEKSGAAHDH